MTHLAGIVWAAAAELYWLWARLVDLKVLAAITVVDLCAVAACAALQVGFAVCLGTKEVVLEAGVFRRVVPSGTTPDEILGGGEEGKKGED